MLKLSYFFSLIPILVMTNYTNAQYLPAEGAGNGGDICESTIQKIASDIGSWIEKGGHESLTLPEGLSKEEYQSKMQKALNSEPAISCTEDKIIVGGSEKTCKNLPSSITCNFTRFMKMTVEQQYALIHHEFAGLAALEESEGGKSAYSISDQISQFLYTTSSKQLTIRRMSSSDFDMVTIPADTYTIATDSSGNTREVIQRYSFAIMTHEVTQLDFWNITRTNPSHYRNRSDCEDTYMEIDDPEMGLVSLCPYNPVEKVTYDQVFNYIIDLNKTTGRSYRLPTVDEWEIAASGGRDTIYGFGNDPKFADRYEINAIKRDHDYSYSHIPRGTQPIGPKRGFSNQPNNFGIYDMLGNVAELTSQRGSSESSVYNIKKGSSHATAVIPIATKLSFYRQGGPSNATGFRLVHTIRHDNEVKDAI